MTDDSAEIKEKELPKDEFSELKDSVEDAEKETLVEEPSKSEDTVAQKEDEIRERTFNDKVMIGTFTTAVVVSFLIYMIPLDFYAIIEVPTRDIVKELLTLVGINAQFSNGFIPPEFWGEGIFQEANGSTPGVFMPVTNSDYWIVKACTGMQAGSILIALILVTQNTPWRNKAIAAPLFFITLFIGNAFRIAFHLWLTVFLVTQFAIDPDTAFYWAHDVLSKPIGFFGVLFFAWVIEKQGVPIIDTFADWMEYCWYRVNSLVKLLPF